MTREEARRILAVFLSEYRNQAWASVPDGVFATVEEIAADMGWRLDFTMMPRREMSWIVIAHSAPPGRVGTGKPGDLITRPEFPYGPDFVEVG